VTDPYAVFGNPIEHSKSPDIHRLFAQQTQQDMDYQRQLVPTDGFRQAVSEFFSSGGKGLNVTVPFKLQAFEIAELTTARADTAGAVNTLWLDPNGQLWADNTDGLGLVSDIVSNQGWPIVGARVLVLGAGGAVRGILQPLLAQEPKAVVIANRTAVKAQQLAQQFATLGSISGGGFEHIEGKFDLIINGTSASIGGDLPPIPATAITVNTCCYDMMYGPEPTVFLQWAEQMGAARRADGLGMLVGQAAESFLIWRGVKPEIAPVVESIRQQMRATSAPGY